MTLGGWVLMTTSVGFVVGLTIFCFARVLRSPAPAERMHAPLDIDTHDQGS